MIVYLTKPDNWDILIDGYERAKIWFAQPYVHGGCRYELFVELDEEGRELDYNEPQWMGMTRGSNSISAKVFCKAFAEDHRDKIILHIWKLIKDSFNCNEEDKKDIYKWILKRNDELQNYFYDNTSKYDYAGDLEYMYACRTFVDSNMTKEGNGLFELLIPLNVFDIINEENNDE